MKKNQYFFFIISLDYSIAQLTPPLGELDEGLCTEESEQVGLVNRISRGAEANVMSGSGVERAGRDIKVISVKIFLLFSARQRHCPFKKERYTVSHIPFVFFYFFFTSSNPATFFPFIVRRIVFSSNHSPKSLAFATLS